MRGDLPTGTVTFLFTDVEGSTRLLHELGPEGYAEALAEHRLIVRKAFRAEGGVEVDTQGDAFFVAFPSAPVALRTAAQILHELGAGPIRLRMGIHTGTPFVTEEGYVGVDVNRAARIAAVGHGGQLLVSSSAAALIGVDGLRDLGVHRLKDLSAPERIYQLGTDEFPPLTSLHRTNLPVPATPFLGRERDLADVLALLTRADVRLLTLVGPGGSGKTRLALQAAGEATERFAHGVFWVPLAQLRNPALVVDTIAGVLGATNELEEHVADKAMLLLLDNVEHVVKAAADLSRLLSACPNLRLLVTSRELLRVPGEQAFSVRPLEPQDGTALFVARARAVAAGFLATAAVPELCARLDNLPLAIELAAARARVLSPEQLLERLSQRLDLLTSGRGADPRQQTLRSTIEWSYELLDERERRLFARLAVFAGGCTLEMAEEVCDAYVDTLESLVDKSLVGVRNNGRFWMLETIREFAAERLEDSGEAAEVRRRHAEYFLALAEEAEPRVRLHDSSWIERLQTEHDNLRAALDFFEAAGEWDFALRTAGALGDFWGIRGHFAEGRRRIGRLLEADISPTAARAKALNVAADLAAENALARRFAEEALATHRALGDTWGAAMSLIHLGDTAAAEDEMAAAEQLWAESSRLFGEVGDEHHRLFANRLLAWAYRDLGRAAQAHALNSETLRQARTLGNRHMEAQALEALAWDLIADDRHRQAVPLIADAYRIHRDVEDAFRVGVSACRFAHVLAHLADPQAAARVLASGRALLEEISGEITWVAKINEQTHRKLRETLNEASLAAAFEEGSTWSIDTAVDIALKLLSSTEPRPVDEER